MYKSIREKIITSIDKHTNFALLLSRKVGATYCHTQNVLKILEKEGIVLKKPCEGCKRIIVLTPKGIRVRELYIKLKIEMSR